MSILLRVLVSNEAEDQVGVSLLDQVSGVEVITYDPTATRLSDQQRTADVFLPPYRGSERPIPLVKQLPNLRLVQLLSAGIDEWSPHVPHSVMLANARGAHAGPVSEWILSAILTTYRRWPALIRYQDQHTWAHRRPGTDFETLSGKRVLVLGAGAIGTAVTRLLPPFGATATLVGRTARDSVRGVDELPEMVSEHDVVVVICPLTPDTEGLIDAKILAAMPDGALLVNAGRGRIVDTDALVAELAAQRLRAALDVTDPEPLPADHPLWSCSGLIVSPHSARTVPGTNRLCYEVAAEQVAALARGETPSNVAAR
ncbi:NAD(P)-dependent oxidoreductase [Kutzneria buriramensis]|uniref:Phosphoglycerate dehydrogenase-like enzyme n=1 Tax=Kutzneria buriramensis TaxID=1045776 RepID=A0A3E0I9Y7_9PSEU|nr:NAD(P)-dependent oxidoreductase [Kutzneria buriramensis]REH55449.1 phosphoglycerate dehydrogenase-like enzyme [Kutzneria buriramensis]